MRSQSSSRRRFLRLAVPALALAAAAPVKAAELAPINVEYCQRQDSYYKVPPGVGQVIPWPDVRDDFPDTRGLLSADRTEVTLADPGCYLVTWALTFEAGPGQDRKSALQVRHADDASWHGAGDGNEMVPTRGQGIDGFGPNETTSVGSAWIRSDGRTRVRLHVEHDSPRPLRISDRAYECHLHVAAWPER